MRSRSSRRLIEWSIVFIVLLLLVGLLGRQMRTLQTQGEIAAVKSTLGALRTALVIDHLVGAMRNNGASVAPSQQNPFLLMNPVPVNYAGSLGTVAMGNVDPGNWVFDPQTSSIGYTPKYGHSLDLPSENDALWFRISSADGVPQLNALRRYIWMGEVMQ